VLYEAAPQAGGRCRSYLDATLGCRIDNGNHLLIAGNTAAMSYVRGIGAEDTLTGPEAALYPFIDLATGERWVVRPNAGRVPWWLLDPTRRVPGTGLLDYLRAWRLATARRGDAVIDVLDRQTTIFRRLWRPLALAALNTGTAEGAAVLLGRVLRESFGQGGEACRPLLPREGLSETLVEPALVRLRALGAEIRFGARLRGLEFAPDRAAALAFDAGPLTLAPGEAVVLAVTAPVATRLVPGLSAPDDFRAIVNAHYRIAAPPGAPPFIGVVGGMAEWVFSKRDVLSVTVSAADRLIDTPADELALRLWRDVVQAYDLPSAELPPWQIVKEKRATFAATPAQLERRPPAATRWPNLMLAGDWTDTGLPSTIEGAIRSGFAAAAELAGPMASQSDEKGLSRGRREAMLARTPQP
jgi:squalene-associated FAD-dependent desaturase